MADPYQLQKAKKKCYHTFWWQKLASGTYHWFPSILQNCEDLTSLILIANFHYEEMPANVNLIFYKKNLVLAYCILKDPIPLWLSNCTKLQLLDLSWNQLGGFNPSLEILNSSFFWTLQAIPFSSRIPHSLTRVQLTFLTLQ